MISYNNANGIAFDWESSNKYTFAKYSIATYKIWNSSCPMNHEKNSGRLSSKDKAPKIYMEKNASWENFEDITTKLIHILPPITDWS